MKNKNTLIKHFLMLFLFLVVFQSSVFAQDIKVTIKDAESRTSLPGATLKIMELKNQYYVTDSKGIVKIDRSLVGKHIEIQYVGYKTKMVLLTNNQQQNIYLDQLPHTIEKVVVTGYSNPNNITSSVVNLSRNDIAHNQMSSLAYIINKLPGVRMLSTGVVEKPIIEGMSGSRIAIINNESKLTGQHWGDDHAPEISIPAFAKVKVIKGAESVKYGSNAIGGIIHISSDINLQETQPKLSLNTNYTNNGREYGADGYFEQSLGKKREMRYRISGKYYRSGDYSTADYLLNNTGSRIINATADFAMQHKAWRYDLHISEYNAKLGIFSGSHIGNYEDLIMRFKMGRPNDYLIKPFSYSVDVPYQNVNHITVNNFLKYTPNSRNQITLIYTWQNDHRREFDYRKGNNIGKPSFAFKLTSNYLETNWKHNFYQSYLKSEVGASVLLVNNSSDRGTNTTPIIPNYVSNESGIYSILTYQPLKAWIFEAGVRADYKYIDSSGYSIVAKKYGGVRNFFSVSGNLGARTDLTSNLNWNTNIGLAWRAPEVNELYSNGVHHGEALYVKGDSLLTTEKAIKITTQLDYRWKNINIKGSAFMSRVFDYIYDIPEYTKDENGQRIVETENWISGIFPVFYYKQSQGIFIGGDLVATWDINSLFRIKMQGEWMWAKDLKTKSYFPNIPANRYTSQVYYHQHINEDWHFSLDLGAQWVSKQKLFDPDVDLLPEAPAGYFLMNAGGSLDYHIRKNGGVLQLYLTSENLLNKLYKDYTNRMRYFAHDKGRSITVGVKYSF